MKRGKELLFLGVFILLTLSLVMQSVFAAEISDESSTTLQVTGLAMCEPGGTRWIDENGNPIPTTGPNGNCLPPGPNHRETSCCPVGFACEETGEMDSYGREKGTCNQTDAYSCTDFRTESECNINGVGSSFAIYFYNKIGKSCYDQTGYSEEPPGSGNYCWNDTACMCKWNGSSCSGAVNHTKLCGDFSPPVEYGICENPILGVVDECDSTGYITYTIGAKWIPQSGYPDAPPDCDEDHPIESKVPCGTVAKLEFFNIFNIISVIIILVIIYYFYFRENFKKK